MENEKVYEAGFPLEETVRKRKSVRTYDEKRPVSADVLAQARAFAQDVQTPFGADVRIAVLEAGAENAAPLGTYGVVRGARVYAAAVVAPSAPFAAEQVGFAFERFVLRLTALGLGTCWLAGTFRRTAFAKAAGVTDSEFLPIASPVGYASSSRSLIDRAFKPQGERIVRKPWEKLFFDGAFGTPLAKEAAGAYALPLELLRLAPSAKNVQPWRIVRADGTFHFYVEHDAAFQKLYALDVQKIDVGIALCHFGLAARNAGLSGTFAQAEARPSAPQGTEYLTSWTE